VVEGAAHEIQFGGTPINDTLLAHCAQSGRRAEPVSASLNSCRCSYPITQESISATFISKISAILQAVAEGGGYTLTEIAARTECPSRPPIA
jgi:hypothetical protein